MQPQPHPYAWFFSLSSQLACVIRDERFQLLNPAWQRCLGHDLVELMARCVIDFVHVDDRENTARALERVWRNEVPAVEFDNRCVRKDRSIAILHWHAAAHVGNRSILAIVEERTETDALAGELRRYQEDLELFCNKSPAMMHSIDHHGTIISASDQWLETMGYRRDEVIGCSSTKFLTEASQRYAKEVILPEYFRTGSCKNVPYQFIKKCGEIIDVELSASSLHNQDGEFIRSLAFIIDVTERNRATAALRDSEEQFRQLAEINRDVCWIRTLSSELQGFAYISPVYEEIWGRPQQALLGQTTLWLSDTHPDDRGLVNDSWRRLPERGYDIEFRVVRPDGGIRWIRDRVYAIEHLGAVHRVIGIAEDITHRKQASAELRRAKKQADAANQAKSQFLAHMSHEMRTPLHAMLGFAQLLAEEIADLELPQSLLDKLDNLTYAGRILNELIGSTLDLASIEAGKLTLIEETLEVRDIFHSCYRMYAEVARGKDVSLTYQVDERLPDRIASDGTRIKQILANLLGNAIKFTPAGKRIDVRVKLVDTNVLSLQVSDQGIGIPNDKLGVIFESFEQVDQGISRQYGGTGLGLTLTKKLTELFGGRLDVDSALGQGTTFTARLPFGPVASPSPGPGPGSARARGRRRVRFTPENRVLVIEDNLLNRKVARGMFALLGLDIDLAENGQEGVRLAIELEPDIIFMDMHMPVMDGLQATRHVRAHPALRHTPIIAMSADAFREQQKAAFDAGVSEYLTKPLSHDKLSSVLQRYLGLDSPDAPDTPDANQ